MPPNQNQRGNQDDADEVALPPVKKIDSQLLCRNDPVQPQCGGADRSADEARCQGCGHKPDIIFQVNQIGIKISRAKTENAKASQCFQRISEGNEEGKRNRAALQEIGSEGANKNGGPDFLSANNQRCKGNAA